MECTHCTQLSDEVRVLRTKVALLEAQVGFLGRHPRIAQGMRGESIVALHTRLPLAPRNASFDVGQGKLKIEVKFSGLYASTKDGSVLRWHWGKVFGQSGNKEYVRLLLIGDKDPRFSSVYLDAESPYVVFDVPYSEVVRFSTVGGTAGSNIRLSSNPETARSRSAELFHCYQITEAELAARYGL